MRNFISITRLLLLYAFAAVGHGVPAYAQSENPPPDQVRAEIRVYLWSTVGTAFWTKRENPSPPASSGGVESKELFIPQGKEFREVKCQPQAYSAPFAYVGPRKFQLFRKGEASNNEASFVPLAEAMLPSRDGKYVLFLDGDPKSPRVLVFPYDAASVSKGKMLLFNGTDKELGVAVGKERVSLKPNAMSVFNVETFTDYQMPIEIYEKSQNDWLQRMKTRRAIRFDERNLGILYQDPSDQSISFSLLPAIKETKQP